MQPPRWLQGLGKLTILLTKERTMMPLQHQEARAGQETRPGPHWKGLQEEPCREAVYCNTRGLWLVWLKLGP